MFYAKFVQISGLNESNVPKYLKRTQIKTRLEAQDVRDGVACVLGFRIEVTFHVLVLVSSPTNLPYITRCISPIVDIIPFSSHSLHNLFILFSYLTGSLPTANNNALHIKYEYFCECVCIESLCL